MSKPLIAVDIDDVLADESSVIRPFINERFNLQLSKADYEIPGAYRGYWERVWGVSAVEGRQMYDEYVASGAKSALHTVPGAIQAIEALKQKYRLAIITARRDHLMDLTHSWLNEHFPNTFEDVKFAQIWDDGTKVPKAQIARELNAAYLIDDSAEHCLLANEAGITSLLFGDFGWSKGVDIPSSIVRVADWEAIQEYFDGVS